MQQLESLNYLDNFRKIYTPGENQNFDHITTLSHDGHLLVFVAEGPLIKYTVLGNTEKAPHDSAAWPAELQTLKFPAELQIAGHEAIGNFILPTVVDGTEHPPEKLAHDLESRKDPILSTTARLGAQRPFHPVSTDMHVYLFRQSVAASDPLNIALKAATQGGNSHTTTAGSGDAALIDSKIMVDRFVLVDNGDKMELVPLRESRYQRSKNKSLPAARTDTLEPHDMEGKPFYEPTMVLSMAPKIGEGGFCVMTLPSENGNGRWQIFIHNAGSDQVEGYSVARSDTGGFDFQGERYYTSPDPAYTDAVLERQPGLCPFTRLPLVPAFVKATGAPRWVLRVPRGRTVFGTKAPAGRLRIHPPLFGPGLRALSIEFWIKPSTPRELLSAGDGAGGNTKTIAAALWSHVKANCIYTPKEGGYNVEILIDINETDNKHVVRRLSVSMMPLPGDMLTEILGMMGSDYCITELRIFYTSRPTNMVVNDKFYQARGDELGLAAYFPLAGGAKNTLENFSPELSTQEQTVTGLPAHQSAPMDAEAEWVLDNPPIEENPGVNRRSLVELDGMQLIGMSCLLYHEQVAESNDMRDIERGDVRVMLAITRKLRIQTGPQHARSEPEEAPGNVLILDWNVTPAGRLARAMPLHVDSVPQLENVQIERPETLLAQLKANKGAIEQRILDVKAQLEEASSTSPHIGGFMGHLGAGLATYISQQPPGLPILGLVSTDDAGGFGSGWPRTAPIGDAITLLPSNRDAQAGFRSDTFEKTPSEAELKAFLTRYEQDLAVVEREIRDLKRSSLYPAEHSAPFREVMTGQSTDGLGCTLCAAWLPFVSTHYRATLFETAAGTISLYFANKGSSQHSELAVANYDVKVVRHAISYYFETTADSNGTLDFLSLVSDVASAATQVSIDIVNPPAGSASQDTKLSISISNELLHIQEFWTGLPNKLAVIPSIINGILPLPEGCEKKVQLYGKPFVDSVGTFPSRLVFARLLLIGDKELAARRFGDPVDIHGRAPAWTSEPAGYSFAARRRFEASLKPGIALSKLHGDRAVTLESWVLPFEAEDPGAPVHKNDCEKIVWMKDRLDDKTTQVLNYGLALSRFIKDPITYLGQGTDPNAHVRLVPNHAFALRESNPLYARAKDGVQPYKNATIEVLINVDVAPQSSILLFIDRRFQLAFNQQKNLVIRAGSTSKTIEDFVPGKWHHIAVVVEEGTAHFLFDGDPYGDAVNIDTFSELILSAGGQSIVRLAELRIWSEARSISEIRALSCLALNGEALLRDNLIAYFYPAMPIRDSEPDNVPSHRSGNFSINADGSSKLPGNPVLSEMVAWPNIAGNPTFHLAMKTVESAPNPFRTVRYQFDDVKRRSVVGIRSELWTHIAVSYAHSYGLTLKSDMTIEATEAGSTLGKDLTIEAALEWNGGVTSILNQRFDRGPNAGSNYEHGAFNFLIAGDGTLLFQFSGKDGSSPMAPNNSTELRTYTYQSNDVLTSREFHSIAVRRWTRSKKIASFLSTDSKSTKDSKTTQFHREIEQMVVDFFIDGKPCGSSEVNKPVNVLERNDVDGEIPLYPRADVSTEDLLKEALAAKSPSTTAAWNDGRPYYAPKIDGAPAPIVLGQALNGSLYDVRLWSSKAEIDGQRSIPDSSSQSGLVHWWRFEDGHGNKVSDAKSPETQWLIKANGQTTEGVWRSSKDVAAHTASLYVNGVLVKTVPEPESMTGDTGFFVGQNFDGLIDELRIWNGSRDEEQILDNMFVSLHDEYKDMIAYYPFNADPGMELHDEAFAGADLLVREKMLSQIATDSVVKEGLDHHSLNNSPARREIGIVDTVLSPFHNRFIQNAESSVWAREYADMQMSSDGSVGGAYKRAYAYLAEGGLHIVTGFKVGSLTSEWLSQVQYEPQLMGYIEGAPPVPGENLTIGPKTFQQDYNGISSIELVDAATSKYTFSHSKERALRTLGEAEAVMTNGYGVKDIVFAPLGWGLTFDGMLNFGGGFRGRYESTEGFLAKDGVTSERESKKTTRFQLNGHWQSTLLEDKAIDPENTASNSNYGYNKTLGIRFIPENKGLALVKSKTADVFALRLKGTTGVVAYRVVPSADIPEDFNLITFAINPKYTKQGTLDGRVGFDGSDSDGFKVFLDKDYKGAEGRGEYSYFKPREAYRLKSQIERDEAALATYYADWNEDTPDLVGPLPGALAGGVAGGVLGIMGVLAGGGGIGAGPVLAAMGLTAAGTVIGKAAMFGKNFDAEPRRLTMDASKRNLVNNYVWTASGGFFELNTTHKDTFSETFTGKFTGVALNGLQAELGIDMKAPGVTAKITSKLYGTVGTTFSVERSKQRDVSEGFSMKVSLAPPNNLRHYIYKSQEAWNFAYGDPYGRKDLPGKVDAYRFMTFFLDGKEANYDDFFAKVVDQKWLDESSDPNAVALRPLKSRSTKSRPWRVMHRVTFVSRILPKVLPAGMGAAETVEQAMSLSQIQSNYELVNKFGNYLAGATSTVGGLAKRLREILPNFPLLVPFEKEIREMLILYYGIPDHTA